MIWRYAGMWTVAMLASANPAFAQSMLQQMGGPAQQQEEVTQPAQELPPLPPAAIQQENQQNITAPVAGQQAQPAAGASVTQPGSYVLTPTKPANADKFPLLPPSRPCTVTDVIGVWKMANVYEMPAGAETAMLADNPVQYFVFNADNTYGKLNAGHNEQTNDVIKAAVAQNNTTALSQYLLQDTGLIYLYQNSNVVENLVCFIVANRRGEFRLGQMLLMPPEGQSKTRLVKVFDKIPDAGENPVQDRPRRGRRVIQMEQQ